MKLDSLGSSFVNYASLGREGRAVSRANTKWESYCGFHAGTRYARSIQTYSDTIIGRQCAADFLVVIVPTT